MWTVVLAGGSGSRFGGAKHLVEFGGKPVLHWSLAAAKQATDGVVLVLPEADIDSGDVAASIPSGMVDRVVVGGETRSESVRSALAAVPDEAEIILIHDAARPLAPAGLFEEVARAVARGADAVVPAVAVSDTIKQVDGRVVVATLDRDALVAVQTPQAFKAQIIRQAHRSGGEAPDDSTLVEQLGFAVEVVDGRWRNLKITVPDDLLVAEAYLYGAADSGHRVDPVGSSEIDGAANADEDPGTS